MRIIHTSDWHLGQYFYGKSRANEHQQFLDWLILQCTELKVDAIIVAGDIFDTATPPSYARQMYFNFISKLQHLDCQLIVLAGNHDSVSMLAESKTLLSSMSTRVIANVTDVSNHDNLSEQVFTLTNKHSEPQAIICAVPFIRPRDVIKSQAGQSSKDKSKNLHQAIVEHYQTLFEHAQALASEHGTADHKLPIIATGHLTALGVTTSDSVRDIYIGTLEALPSNAFPSADYIALGHIHRAQKVGKTEHIRYCGSPIALSFDEAKQQKRVLMVEFSQDTLTAVNDIPVPCFQSLAMVKTSIDDLKQDIALLVKEKKHNQTLDQSNETTKIWLDIELSNSGVLSDLQPRIMAIIEDFPVEVLLVRRAKQVRKRLLSEHQAEYSTLSELTIDDVFTARLNLEPSLNEATENDDSDDSDDRETSSNILARRTQLQTLFKQAVEGISESHSPEKVEQIETKESR